MCLGGGLIKHVKDRLGYDVMNEIHKRGYEGIGPNLAKQYVVLRMIRPLRQGPLTTG